MDAIKNILNSMVDQKVKTLSEADYNKMWSKIQMETSRSSFKQVFVHSLVKRRKLVIAASFVIVVGLISSNFMFKTMENADVGNKISSELKYSLERSKEMQRSYGLYVSNLICYNNSVYQMQDSIKENEIGKILGTTYGREVFDLLDESSEKAVALNLGNGYYMKYIIVQSPEKTVIENALSSFEEYGLEFSSEEGSVESIFEYNGRKIPVKLTTEIIDNGNFRYNVILKANWNSSNVEKMHTWELAINFDEWTIVSDLGDKISN